MTAAAPDSRTNNWMHIIHVNLFIKFITISAHYLCCYILQQNILKPLNAGVLTVLKVTF